MSCTCHTNARTKMHKNPKRFDPAGVSMLQRRFIAEAVRRFRLLKKQIHEMVVTGDCFGLVNAPLRVNYSPDQPRDEKGRFSDGDEVSGASEPTWSWKAGKHEDSAPGDRFYDSLSTKEADDIQNFYTADAQSLNSQLEMGGALENHWQETVDMMDGLFVKAPPTEKDLTLYRVTPKEYLDPDKMKVGDTFTNKKYTSTSGNTAGRDHILHVIDVEGVKEPQTTMEIRLPKGSKVLPLNGDWNEYYQNQEEYLLPRNTTFKVVSIKDDHFVLDVVDKKPKTNAKEFAFTTSALKVDEFMLWLQEMINKDLLDAVLVSKIRKKIGAKAWSQIYLQAAYKKGMVLADKAIIAKGMTPSTLPAQPVFPVDYLFNLPIHADRVGLIYTRTYNELKGVTDAMAQGISRSLAQGIAEGKGPRQIAKEMNKLVDGIGIKRATLIARTEIMRAHHVASINTYREAGVEGVMVQAEWATAKDDKVCDECAELEGQVFTLDEIEPLLPRHPNCILDGQVPVFTQKGWKPIKSIQVGDKVLTHKGRFRTVTKTHKNQAPAETPCIKFGTTHWTNGNWRKLSVTDNHPILTARGWIDAKELIKGDMIYMLAKKCDGCEKLVPWNVKYCCKSCASHTTTTEQWKDPQIRKAMSEAVSRANIESYKNGNRKRLNKGLEKSHILLAKRVKWGLHHLQDPEVHRKANQTNGRKHNSGTWLERRLLWALKEMGLNPERGFAIPVHNKNSKGHQRYRFPDFAFPKHKLAVEADGVFWHTDDVDAARDKELQQAGWSVLHFTEKQIDTDLMGCAKEVSRLLLNHSHSYCWAKIKVDFIEKWNLGKARQVFNLTVDEDESYHAHGWVVHNCRCVALPVVDPAMMVEDTTRRETDDDGNAPVTLSSRRSWRQRDIYPGVLKVHGGPGSGNFGHAGRPGEVGGSAPQGFRREVMSRVDAAKASIKTIAEEGFAAGKSNAEILAYIHKHKLGQGINTKLSNISWYKTQWKKSAAGYIAQVTALPDAYSPTKAKAEEEKSQTEKLHDDFLAKGIWYIKNVMLNDTNLELDKKFEKALDLAATDGVPQDIMMEAFYSKENGITPVPSMLDGYTAFTKAGISEDDAISAIVNYGGHSWDNVNEAVKQHKMYQAMDVQIKNGLLHDAMMTGMGTGGLSTKDAAEYIGLHFSDPNEFFTGMHEAGYAADFLSTIAKGSLFTEDQFKAWQDLNKNAWKTKDYTTIKDLLIAGIKAKAPTPEMLQVVKEKFPGSNTTANSIAYYKTQLNKAAKQASGQADNENKVGQAMGAIAGGTTSPDYSAPSYKALDTPKPFPNDAPFPETAGNWNIVQKLGGSTGAVKVVDDKGNYWVRKAGASKGQSEVETIADDAYRAAGIAVPASKTYIEDGKTYRLAQWTEGQQLGEYMKSHSPAETKAVLEKVAAGFHMDALLGHYDIAGASFDNILVDKSGTPWRIDNGGTFEYRAQGAKKDAGYGEYPEELWSLRDKNVNANAATLFSAARWFNTSAQLEAMDLKKITEAIPAGVRRDMFTKRAEHAIALAHSALDGQHAGYNEKGMDETSHLRLELRQAGLLEKFPKSLTYDGAGGYHTDANDVPRDTFFKKTFTGVSVSNADYVSKETPLVQAINKTLAAITQAAISVSHHGEKGEPPNSSKISAMKTAMAELKTISIQIKSDTPEQKAYDHLQHMKFLVEKYGGQNKAMPKSEHIINDITFWKMHGEPEKPVIVPKGPTPAQVNDKTAFGILRQAFDKHGIDYDATVGRWQNDWAGSTKGTESRGFKAWLRQERFSGDTNDNHVSEHNFQTELTAAQFAAGGPAKLDTALRLQKAYVQEMLENVEFPGMYDRTHRVLGITRTEEEKNVPNYSMNLHGKEVHLLRHVASAGSHDKFTFVKGDVRTLQSVPFIDIHSSLMVPKSSGGGGGFAGQSENEYIFTHTDLPTKVVDNTHSNGLPPISGNKKEASTWNLSTQHLRTLTQGTSGSKKTAKAARSSV